MRAQQQILQRRSQQMRVFQIVLQVVLCKTILTHSAKIDMKDLYELSLVPNLSKSKVAASKSPLKSAKPSFQSKFLFVKQSARSLGKYGETWSK